MLAPAVVIASMAARQCQGGPERRTPLRRNAMADPPSLAAELSRAIVGGHARQTQTVFLLKPLATLSWNTTDKPQFRLAAKRLADQLDSFNLAAPADSETNMETSVYPDLPSQAKTSRCKTMQCYNITLASTGREGPP